MIFYGRSITFKLLWVDNFGEEYELLTDSLEIFNTARAYISRNGYQERGTEYIETMKKPTAE